MFGIDPEAINNLANLQQQILAFMAASNAAFAKIEAQLNRIEAAQKAEHEHA